jgi:hypothetical protein
MNHSYSKGTEVTEGTEGESKRQLTPYNKFVKKMYVKLRTQYPNYTAPQIMKKIGEEWRKQSHNRQSTTSPRTKSRL